MDICLICRRQNTETEAYTNTNYITATWQQSEHWKDKQSTHGIYGSRTAKCRLRAVTKLIIACRPLATSRNNLRGPYAIGTRPCRNGKSKVPLCIIAG